MKRRSAWPHVHLKKYGDWWRATAFNCNVVAVGSTPAEAYKEWWRWYTMPY